MKIIMSSSSSRSALLFILFTFCLSIAAIESFTSSSSRNSDRSTGVESGLLMSSMHNDDPDDDPDDLMKIKKKSDPVDDALANHLLLADLFTNHHSKANNNDNNNNKDDNENHHRLKRSKKRQQQQQQHDETNNFVIDIYGNTIVQQQQQQQHNHHHHQSNNNNSLERKRNARQTTTKIVVDSSNLKLEFCDNCDIYLGGLFPIHAPKYQRQHHLPVRSPQSPPHNLLLRSNTNTNTNSNKHLLTPPIDPQMQMQMQMQMSANDILINSLTNSMSCGEIKKERGIQRLEAMLFAIDHINNKTSILPGIRLGAKVFDTCDRDTIALEKCINFVSDYFLLNDENVVNDFSCEAPNANSIFTATSNYNYNSNNYNNYNNNNNGYAPRKKYDLINKRKVVGVIGAASSSVSIQVANLLRLFQVPQISYASTSPELSNKERFPSFSRVLPSDTLQAEAMAEVVLHLNMNYVATINEEGQTGGIESFVNHAKTRSKLNITLIFFSLIIYLKASLFFYCKLLQKFAYQARTRSRRRRQKMTCATLCSKCTRRRTRAPLSCFFRITTLSKTIFLLLFFFLKFDF